MAGINKLTNGDFIAFKATDVEQMHSDGGGLFVRIRKLADGGSISFRFTYRIDGKQKWLTLGTFPILSLKEARALRDIQKSKLSQGLDPSIEKQLSKERIKQQQLAEKTAIEEQSARMTVNSLFERWEKLALSSHKDKGVAIKRAFQKDVLPTIGNIAVEDIKKSHIIGVVDDLLERGVERTAKLTLSRMRQMFRFAQDRDIIEHDPTSSIRKAKIGGKDTIRDRYLSDAEIKSLSAQIESARMLTSTECALWLMLSTCCRIGEICKARWEHLDLEAGTWTIPSDNSKNKKAHLIYLSDFAKAEFKKLSEIRQSEEWIYPNTDNTDHVCEKSITKQVGDRQLDENRSIMSGRSKHRKSLVLAGGKWTPHDLRRTGATIMGNLGVRPDVIELCLNHIEQNKMKRTYQHQALKTEQAEAWKLLGERLELLTNPSITNVIPLQLKAS